MISLLHSDRGNKEGSDSINKKRRMGEMRPTKDGGSGRRARISVGHADTETCNYSFPSRANSCAAQADVKSWD